MSDTYSAPEWAKHVIWYQIFPERFANGDSSNDPQKERVQEKKLLPDDWAITRWTSDWYARARWETEMGPDFEDSIYFRRYGGDLQGIINKLDYLQDLGISALYLNPIFDAVSLHKYDTANYRHVDRFFGPDPAGDAKIMDEEDPQDPSTWQWTTADKLFLSLIEEVHDRGMKIIIDAVFNHTGTQFWAFRNLQKIQQNSPFANWYDVISFADEQSGTAFDYESWWGVKSLPELNEDANGNLVEPVREHLKAITRRWMDPHETGDPSAGVDGWRLDVPEEIGQPFWREWCAMVRAINPQAFISGEIWDKKARNWVNGDLFTAVMNYQVAETLQCYLIDEDLNVDEFDARLRDIREHFPEESNYVMQNLIDSHDTPRVGSMVLNPGRQYDKMGKPEDGFDVRKPGEEALRVQRLIALFQFTYVGAPMVYYGDEAGMWGADDPHNRKPMCWPDMDFDDEKEHPLGEERPVDKNTFNHELHAWYKKLATIRNTTPALRTGSFKQVYRHKKHNCYGFERKLDDDFVFVLMNRSEQPREFKVHLPEGRAVEQMVNLLNADDEVRITNDAVFCTVPAISGTILEAK